jgi:ubiquinol-cytochrome c reductase iron-sulfur subunit
VDNNFYDNRASPERPDPTGRTFSYLVAGSSAFLYASVARVAVVKFLASWQASADVMALSSIEVDVSNIAEGSASTVKWRGKPVFVVHRTKKQIQQAKEDDKLVQTGGLRDPELDKDRTQDENWMIVLGVCTHLGCVPIANSGDYNGWFCPCHGSHYDTSGRVRKGPAPLNLEVPQYKFLSPTKVLIG